MAHIHHLILKTDNQLTDQSIMTHIHHLILKTDNQLTDQSSMAHIHHLILKTDNQLTDQSIMIHTRSSPNPKKQSTDWSVNQLWHNGWTKSNHTLNQSINPNNPSTSFNHQINLDWHINEYSHFNCHTGFRIKYKTQNPFFSFSVQVCEQISIKIHSTEVDLLYL